MNAFARSFTCLLLFPWAGHPWTGAIIPFEWPQVRPTDQSYAFPIASRADVNLLIVSMAGSPLYRFRCVPDFPAESGTMDGLGCYLIVAGSKDDELDSATLLDDDPMEQRIPHGRGQIWTDAVRASCASYPEYGAERHFRLRGMKITLRMTSVEFGPNEEYQNPTRTVGTIRSFGLKVTVAPDPGAMSAIAEPIPIVPPTWKKPLNSWNAHPDCSTVVPAHVPGNVTDGLMEKQGLLGPFPPVASQEKTLVLNAEQEQGHDFAFLRTPMPPDARMVSWSISGPGHEHLYDVACSGYEAAGGPDLQGNVIPRRFDRYGIVCGLFLPGKDFNLLADGVDRYSQMNPAQILPGQLFGECGDYPDWGRHRVFHLRGMRLTMRFADPVFTTGDFAPHALASARLALQVEPDPSATSPVAAPPETIYWGILNGPNPCQNVLVAPNKSGS